MIIEVGSRQRHFIGSRFRPRHHSCFSSLISEYFSIFTPSQLAAKYLGRQQISYGGAYYRFIFESRLRYGA